MYRTPTILRLSLHRETSAGTRCGASARTPKRTAGGRMRRLHPPLPRPPRADDRPRQWRDTKGTPHPQGPALRTRRLRRHGRQTACHRRRRDEPVGQRTRRAGVAEQDPCTETPQGRPAARPPPAAPSSTAAIWAEHMLLEARLEELSPEEQESLRRAMAVVTELLCGMNEGDPAGPRSPEPCIRNTLRIYIQTYPESCA